MIEHVETKRHVCRWRFQVGMHDASPAPPRVARVTQGAIVVQVSLTASLVVAVQFEIKAQPFYSAKS